MKRILSFLLILLLALSSFALGEQDGMLVCLGCTVNGEPTVTFSGKGKVTAIADLGEGEIVDAWKLNGTVVEGEKNIYLVFEAEGVTVVEAVKVSAADQPETTDPTGADQAQTPGGESGLPEEERRCVLRSIGATIQYLDADKKGKGTTYTEIDFTDDYRHPISGKKIKSGTITAKITADRPSSGAIDYWVIDGIKYYFDVTVKFITVYDLKESMTVEVVYKNKESKTLLTGEQIESARTGETLTVTSINARMNHLHQKTNKTGQESFTEFDFTDDYANAVTGETMRGVAHVKVSTKYSNINYWLFNGVEIHFSTEPDRFYAHGIYKSMVYEVRGSDNVNVSCDANCTFSGGGYTNARSGSVPRGTTITVRAREINMYVNGQPVYGDGYVTKYYTVNQDSYITVSWANN